MELELDALFALVHEHDCMERVATRLARLTNSQSCGLGLQDSRSYDVLGGWTHGISDQHLLAYRDRYCHCDPTVVEHFKRPPESAYFSIYTGADPEFQNSVFYKEWCVPQGMYFFAGTYTRMSHDRTLRITFQRNQSQGKFTKSDLALIDQFTPHIRRVAEINSSFNDLALSKGSLQHTLNLLPQGLILLDVNSRVVSNNLAAQSVLGGSISILNRKLKIQAPAKAAKLASLIDAALHPDLQSNGELAAGTVVVERELGPPLTLLVSAFTLDTGMLISPFPEKMVAIFIQNPAREIHLADSAVSDRFGLSPKEARLVRHLCEGHALDDISQLMKVSMHTVRDHLKKVFRKTNTTRQAELVARVLVALTVESNQGRDRDYIEGAEIDPILGQN